MSHRIYIGIGSNLGDRRANTAEAIDRITKIPDTRVVRASSLYESEPLGDAKTWFVNSVIEIETDPGRTFDYAGKYFGSGTREICPARIPDAMRDAAQRAAVAAHIALGCEGYSRTDLIATGDDEVWFLELNTLPGLTTSSLVPQELATVGIGFREFLERQVEAARGRIVHAARA